MHAGRVATRLCDTRRRQNKPSKHPGTNTAINPAEDYRMKQCGADGTQTTRHDDKPAYKTN